MINNEKSSKNGSASSCRICNSAAMSICICNAVKKRIENPYTHNHRIANSMGRGNEYLHLQCGKKRIENPYTHNHRIANSMGRAQARRKCGMQYH
jgi:hypothetical protein